MAKHRQKCPKNEKCRKTVKKTVKNVEKQFKIKKNSQKTVKNVEKPLKWQKPSENSQKCRRRQKFRKTVEDGK